MERKIEFDANIRGGLKPHLYPTGWIPIPDDEYEKIPTHVVAGKIESVERFTVTLSPVDKPGIGQPDYEVTWKEFEVEAIWDGRTWKLQLPRNWHNGIHSPMMETKCTFLIRVKRKHTPQAQNPKGTKPEIK